MAFAVNKTPVLALISPNENAYSETFIAAHRKLLPFNVKYYYNGNIPKELHGEGALLKYSIFYQIICNVKHALCIPPNMSLQEEALLRSFKKHRVDVALAEYGTTGASITLVCKKLQIPLFVHFHGFDASEQTVIAKYKDKYTLMFEYALNIFSVSNTMTKMLECLGCPPNKIVYTICGPHEDFFRIKTTGNQNTFVSIGRFTDKKAPYYTILAFKKVLDVYPDTQLIIAGDGVLKNTCANLINYLGISKQVQLIGVVKRENWILYLSNAFAFVQHSITAANGDMEGTPVAILEACAAGIPVIATRHGGITDIIQHMQNGLLVNEHDVEGMADLMLYLLKNKAIAKQLGEAAKKLACERFTMQQHINTITQAINTAIAV
jgi:colanic acid/amylovoran biosynthesis glycosyltransferase